MLSADICRLLPVIQAVQFILHLHNLMTFFQTHGGHTPWQDEVCWTKELCENTSFVQCPTCTVSPRYAYSPCGPTFRTARTLQKQADDSFTNVDFCGHVDKESMNWPLACLDLSHNNSTTTASVSNSLAKWLSTNQYKQNDKLQVQCLDCSGVRYGSLSALIVCVEMVVSPHCFIEMESLKFSGLL